MNTFDLIILILLGIGGIAGFQKGLITGLSRFIGKIAAIVIAVFFHIQFLDAVEGVLNLRATIEPRIGSFLAGIAQNKVEGGEQFGDPGSLIQPVVGEAAAVLTDYLLRIGSLLLLFLLAAFVINLLISVVITPLAKTLSIVNRGGGLAFGILSMLIGVCLIMGLVTPFLTTANSDFMSLRSSILYPWLMQGYKIIVGIISAWAGDIFSNPLEAFPVFKDTLV